MPNHFHGIVDFVTDAGEVGPEPDAQIHPSGVQTGGAPHSREPLPTIIQWFKTMTTNEYVRGVKSLGWPPFDRKLWQRNYFEHIIRSEEELRIIRLYIQNNPAQWALDRENPNQAQT